MRKCHIIEQYGFGKDCHTNIVNGFAEILAEVKTGGEDCDGYNKEGIAVIRDQFGTFGLIRTAWYTGTADEYVTDASYPLGINGAKSGAELATILRKLADEAEAL